MKAKAGPVTASASLVLALVMHFPCLIHINTGLLLPTNLVTCLYPPLDTQTHTERHKFLVLELDGSPWHLRHVSPAALIEGETEESERERERRKKEMERKQLTVTTKTPRSFAIASASSGVSVAIEVTPPFPSEEAQLPNLCLTTSAFSSFFA